MATTNATKYFVLVIVSLLLLFTQGFAQEPEEEGVRGSFLTSRPAPSNSKSSNSAPRRNTKTNSGRSDNSSTGQSSHPKFTGNGDSSTAEKRVTATGPIGLGYSVYMKDRNGDPIRVEPTHEFHFRDSLRVSLEANTDGYLYVFYTENGSNPVMLFPDARLVEGTNRISAHVPYDVPSGHEPDPSRRWFVFDDKPATESLYIVVTRQPLPAVPIADSLLAYCNGRTDCVWQPPQSAWAMVRKGLDNETHVSTSETVGQRQSDTEREATTRGIGLDTSAPAPTVVRMNVSSNAPVLVTQLDLIHK